MDTAQKIAEAIKEHESRLHRRNGRFVPPTAEQVMEYAYSLVHGQSFDAQGFVDFYESKGWKVGNQKMRSWKASVRTWKGREPIAKSKRTKLLPIPGKHCSKCRMPAIYKTGGDFDFYYCADHMPDIVKEKYCG